MAAKEYTTFKVYKNDMRKFSALAKKKGVRSFILFNNIFDFYIKNNKEKNIIIVPDEV